MSDGNETLDASCCCASCGIAELDDIKLVPCDGCDLVRYCSDACREDHKADHEEACKKRAADLREEILFRQPECTHRGDCPICTVPIPLDPAKSGMYMCCSKVICKGCAQANQMREIRMRLRQSCPFCRKPLPKTQEEHDKLNMKRVEANDPDALCHEGVKQYNKGNYHGAFKYWTKAAAMDNVEAHYQLSLLYLQGKGVEKDEGKEMLHLEEAAIGGHPDARCMLGLNEMDKGNAKRAAKHFLISAKQGDDLSIKSLMEAFKQGFVEKDDLASALRAYQVAVDATKT